MNIKQHYRFTLPPLGYEYDALEPYIDEKTVRIHHDAHFKAYTDNLNDALKDYPKLWEYSASELLTRPKSLPKEAQIKILRNAGGYYNHDFYFKNLRPGREDNKAYGRLEMAIGATFGGFDAFKKEFKAHALEVFGSGWLWLVKGGGKIRILPTYNQESPISLGYSPLICIDVWEHAYYLKYQNRRAEYIDNWFYVANWSMAEKLYDAKTRSADI